MISRRELITGLVSFVAAPAIVRVSSLMPVRSIIEPSPGILVGWNFIDACAEDVQRFGLGLLKNEGGSIQRVPLENFYLP